MAIPPPVSCGLLRPAEPEPVQVAHQRVGESHRLDSLGLVIVSNLGVADRVAEHPHLAREQGPEAVVVLAASQRVSQRTALPERLVHQVDAIQVLAEADLA